ncbi:MAG TPA: type II toxin-antitoxin system VapC family toxin [Planctomycetota bacterium]|nr:type II toxin-antitoxin system VapC family toxin [Planctomycetota bacterium]
MILLDTHFWIWWLLGNARLTLGERQALDSLASKRLLAISIISVWEAELLERRKRITLDRPFEDWISAATDPRVVSVLPIEIETIISLRSLPDALPNDPGDRIITGTAKVLRLPLATRDKNIIASQSVTIWKP